MAEASQSGGSKSKLNGVSQEEIAQAREDAVRINPNGKQVFDRLVGSGQFSLDQAYRYATNANFTDNINIISSNGAKISTMLEANVSAAEILGASSDNQQNANNGAKVIHKDDSSAVTINEGSTIGMSTLKAINSLNGEITALKERFHVDEIMMAAQVALGPVAAFKALAKSMVSEQVIGETVNKATDYAATHVTALAHKGNFETTRYALNLNPESLPGSNEAERAEWSDLHNQVTDVFGGAKILVATAGSLILGMSTGAIVASGDGKISHTYNQIGAINPSGRAPRGRAPNGYVLHDVDAHGRLSPNANRSIGNTNTRSDNFVQSHHPIQSEWAEKNVPKYNRNDAPGILLESKSGMSHAQISAAQREFRFDLKNQGLDPYSTTINQEFHMGYKQMLDAGVPQDVARKAIKDSYKYFDSLGAFK